MQQYKLIIYNLFYVGRSFLSVGKKNPQKVHNYLFLVDSCYTLCEQSQ